MDTLSCWNPPFLKKILLCTIFMILTELMISVGKYVMVNRVKYSPVSDIRIAGKEEKSV